MKLFQLRTYHDGFPEDEVLVLIDEGESVKPGLYLYNRKRLIKLDPDVETIPDLQKLEIIYEGNFIPPYLWEASSEEESDRDTIFVGSVGMNWHITKVMRHG